MKLKSLFSLILKYSFFDCLDKLIYFGLILYTLRRINATEYGQFAMLQTGLGFMLSIGFGIFYNSLVRYYYTYNETERKQFISTFGFVVSALSVVCFFSLFFFKETIASALELSSSTVLLFLCIILFQPLSALGVNCFKMDEQIRHYGSAVIGRVLITVFVTTLLLHSGYMLQSLIVGTLAGEFFAWSFVILKLQLKLKWIQKKYLTETYRYGVETILSSGSVWCLNSGDRFVVHHFLGPSGVGIYSFIYNAAKFWGIVCTNAFANAVKPTLFKLENNKKLLNTFLNTTLGCYLFCGGILIPYIVYVGKYALNAIMVGSVYPGYWSLFPVIATALLLHGSGTLLSAGVILSNRGYLISFMAGVAALANIAFNFILVPFIDLQGAAYATLISYVIWNLFKAHFSQKYHDIRFDRSISIISLIIVLNTILLERTFHIGAETETTFLIIEFLILPIIFWYSLTAQCKNEILNLVKKVFYKQRL